MPTARELLDRLNKLDEHSEIEAKTSEEAGKSAMETVCAFANEPGLGGGYLLLGVAPAKDALWPTYEARGVAKPDKVQADFASMCSSYFNIALRPQISVEEVDGKNVIKVFIPEAQLGEKPIFIKSVGLPKGAFRRIGSTDQRCNEDDLLLFYQNKGTRTYDESIVPDATIEDIDNKAVSLYRSYRREANPSAEELRWPIEELLIALGCACKHGRTVHPTVAGILLFGTAQALRRFFPMMRIDYVRVQGKEWVQDPSHRFDTVEIRDPLIRAIRKTHTTVLDDLPKAFSLSIGRVQRRDVPLIPDRVIREAIVNAVMHRTYRTHGPIQVIRYSNRLEIRNPGNSLVAEDRLGSPGSTTRNPKIAAVLHETRFAETKGSGIRVMREMMREANLSAPLFKSDRSGDQFVATFLFHHFLGPEDLVWLKNFSHLDLTDEERKALIYVREMDYIDNAAYREMNCVDTLSASSSLRRLRDAGLLEMHGRGSATFYAPTASFPSLAPGAVLTPELKGLTPELKGLTPELKGLTPELIPDAQRPEYKTSVASAILQITAGLGRRSPPEKIRSAILKVCALKPFKASELAHALKREQRHLTKKYLTPLVKEKKLELTIPHEPNSPNQAYKTRAPS